MLLRLIDDMNRALEHNCFFSALSMALTIPDICGKAKYPSKRVGERYIAWYDEYVGKYEQCPGEEGKMPYLSGEVIYQLRCFFLHQGNPNIDAGKIKEDCCKIDKFVLMVEKEKEFNSMADSASCSQNYFRGQPIGPTERTYNVNVRRLCYIISACAESYYEDNKEKFDFFDFSVIDLDEEQKEREEWRRINNG